MAQTPSTAPRPEAAARVDRTGWLVALVAIVLLFVVALQPDGFAQQGSGSSASQQGAALRVPLSGGVSADSNGTMIAVTGMDVTGASVLYLVDTKKEHLVCYQASGGAGSTRGVKLVGARKIGLDLRLDGFNDKTENDGKPLRYKDLERMFVDKGLPTDD